MNRQSKDRTDRTNGGSGQKRSRRPSTERRRLRVLPASMSVPGKIALMTMFDTPVVTPLLRIVARLGLKLCGWRCEGERPACPKYVMIMAPHTSNWDMPFMLCVSMQLGIKARWFGKKELFRPPFGFIMRWMGGMPVDRGTSSNLVAAMVAAFGASDELVIGFAPEGTRAATPYWKTGFYQTAKLARVPIVCGYLDYRRKAGGIGLLVTPGDSLADDLLRFDGFYRNITGKYPQNAGRPALKPPKQAA